MSPQLVHTAIRAFLSRPCEAAPIYPMLHSSINKAAHTVGSQHHIKFEGSNWMFDALNHPMRLIRKDVCCVNEDPRLTTRQESLLENLDPGKQNE